jgi:hypothetical protein
MEEQPNMFELFAFIYKEGGRAIVMADIAGFSPRKPGFAPWAVHV